MVAYTGQRQMGQTNIIPSLYQPWLSLLMPLRPFLFL